MPGTHQSADANREIVGGDDGDQHVLAMTVVGFGDSQDGRHNLGCDVTGLAMRIVHAQDLVHDAVGKSRALRRYQLAAAQQSRFAAGQHAPGITRRFLSQVALPAAEPRADAIEDEQLGQVHGLGRDIADAQIDGVIGDLFQQIL